MSRTLIPGIGCAVLLALAGSQEATAKHHATATGAKVVSGEVVLANAADQSFVVRTHAKLRAHDRRFVLASDGQVTKAARPAAFDDIEPMQTIKVTYRPEQKHRAETVDILAVQGAPADGAPSAASQ